MQASNPEVILRRILFSSLALTKTSKESTF
jgi:hypothetical protein